jgi:hypothetical protein
MLIRKICSKNILISLFLVMPEQMKHLNGTWSFSPNKVSNANQKRIGRFTTQTLRWQELIGSCHL